MGKGLAYCSIPSRMAGKTEEIMDFVQAQRYAPFNPLLAFPRKRFEDGAVGREETLEICLRATRICDELWLFGISEGTVAELEYFLTGIIFTLYSGRTKRIKFFFKEFDPAWRENLEKLEKEYKPKSFRINAINFIKESLK